MFKSWCYKFEFKAEFTDSSAGLKYLDEKRRNDQEFFEHTRYDFGSTFAFDVKTSLKMSQNKMR